MSLRIAIKAYPQMLRTAWGIRGIAWWNGKVYTGTQDGRLVALDAKSGKPVWSVETTSKGDGRFITGAPRVFDGKIIICHGGADSSNNRGYVTTYDAETGKLLWRFYIVPGNPADVVDRLHGPQHIAGVRQGDKPGARGDGRADVIRVGLQHLFGIIARARKITLTQFQRATPSCVESPRRSSLSAPPAPCPAGPEQASADAPG